MAKKQPAEEYAEETTEERVPLSEAAETSSPTIPKAAGGTPRIGVVKINVHGQGITVCGAKAAEQLVSRGRATYVAD